MTDDENAELGTLARRWLDANARLDEARDEVEGARCALVAAVHEADYAIPVLLHVDDERIEVRIAKVQRLAYVREIIV